MRPRAINIGGFTLLPVILAMSLIAAIAFLLNRDNGVNAEMIAIQSEADRARYVAEAGLHAVNAITQGKCGGYTGLATTSFGAGSFTATVTPATGSPVTLTATGTTSGGASATLTRSNVAVVGGTSGTTPQTLTLQPGDTGGIDAWLNGASAKGDINNGVNPRLTLSTGSTAARPLLKFDLSAIPAGSTVTAATLSLYQETTGSVGSSPANPVYNMHRVTRAWLEGTGYGNATGDGATWNKYDSVNLWTAAGGDFDPVVAASTPAAATLGWKTWDVTGLVGGWVNGSYANHGMLMDGVGAISTLGFASSDNGTAANRPKLVVTFLPPCGWPPGATLPAIKDTWISEARAGMNYGSGISFTVTNAASRGRGLVQFDLSTIPAGARFTSATLRLFAGGFSATVPPTSSILTVNPVLAPWTENGATWKTANGSMNSWLCGCWGGYFAPAAASATLSSSFTPGGWVEWNVTALAQEWLDGIRLNYGVGVLMDPASASSFAFNSKEATFAPQYMPQLVLAW